TAANAVRGTATGGDAGRGGDRAFVRSDRAGDARARIAVPGSRDHVTVGKIVGGDSIASVSANGGDGGDADLTLSPQATTGDSGAAIAQSSATNTGDTGPASSTADANPVAVSGNSGMSGKTGDADATVTQTDTSLLLSSKSVTGAARSGNTGDSGATGDARASGTATSHANSGADSKATAHSGSTGVAANDTT